MASIMAGVSASPTGPRQYADRLLPVSVGGQENEVNAHIVRLAGELSRARP